MALAFPKVPFQNRFSGNGITEVIVDITLDTSYPTGGYTISPSKIGIKTIFGAQCIGYKGAASLVADVLWSHSTGKLIARRTAAGTLAGNVVVKGGGIGEAIGINPDSNAGVLSKAAATDRTIPITTFLGGAQTIAQGGLVEVANTTNLSAITVRMKFSGI